MSGCVCLHAVCLKNNCENVFIYTYTILRYICAIALTGVNALPRCMVVCSSVCATPLSTRNCHLHQREKRITAAFEGWTISMGGDGNIDARIRAPNCVFHTRLVHNTFWIFVVAIGSWMSVDGTLCAVTERGSLARSVYFTLRYAIFIYLKSSSSPFFVCMPRWHPFFCRCRC